jgi:hypothetical protein
MSHSSNHISDKVEWAMTRVREVEEGISVLGTVTWEMRDSVTGEIKSQGQSKNLVTQVGDQVNGERAAGIGAAGAAATCAKLGTGTTAPSKTGAGAALGTYIATSSIVHDATYPQSSLNGSSRRITFKFTFGAGAGTTATAIGEIALCNSANADATTAAANTLARALISPGAKAAADVLTITWTHDYLGA